MSLNKLTNYSDYLDKQYLNIGCNDIKCSTLEVDGKKVNSNISGSYSPAITVSDGSSLTQTIGNYIITASDDNSILDLSVTSNMTAASALSAYVLTVPLPENHTVVLADPFPCVGYLHDLGGAYANYVAQTTGAVVGSNSVSIVFNEITSTQAPPGSTLYVQFSLKLRTNV